MEMKPLSADAQARMTEMVKEVLEPAMKQQAQRNPEDFVYTAPEVWMQQVLNVGARIVNRAVTIAFKDWGLAEESCAWCLEYEHGMKPATAVCTCQHHCGATVCPAQEAKKCGHTVYNFAGNCAEISCDNYVGKHVR